MNSKVLTARVSEQLFRRTCALANARKCDRQAVVIKALGEYLAGYDPRTPAERAADADYADLQDTLADLRGGLHG